MGLADLIVEREALTLDYGALRVGVEVLPWWVSGSDVPDLASIKIENKMRYVLRSQSETANVTGNLAVELERILSHC